ncbi:hypothetical protein ALC57_06308 [Trachymyrmex cornetzi]|uniref:DUF5641 domain-containing protein n=1 Tax=Trachymyrmex cornetzi TaxID=471704 RepID=A0A195E986_9HYME|nr:hypothetical protein ALC57_06308 [Trachymyrmex cornetzi]
MKLTFDIEKMYRQIRMDGMSPSSLLSTELWWNGPVWLSQDATEWCIRKSSMEQEIPEARGTATSATIQQETPETFNRYSTLNKLIQVQAYILRFIHNSRPDKCKRRGDLSTIEIDAATHSLVKMVQASAFSSELRQLLNHQSLPRSSKLLPLTPFLDEQQILRVGGRLQRANLPYSARHQMLLPSNHPFTKLLIENEHSRLLHLGSQTTLASIRQKFWPLNGRNIVRLTIRKCIKCFRSNPSVIQPIMGNLPRARVQVSRPFAHVGVDFCGPFYLRESKRRNSKTNKSYVAIFVCLATLLTTDEMLTLLIQIESILNSRPITVLSNDPNDLTYLSPGHFLIGDVFTDVPEPTLLNIQDSRLSRWQRVDQMRKRWSKDYLHQLQQRTKWRIEDINVTPGNMVLIKEDNTLPLHWPLGRVLEVHPGDDGIVRTATIKTSKGIFKRSANRLSLFPMEQ